jgi:hypothetical protein
MPRKPKPKPMTPAEFAEKMKTIFDGSSPESTHAQGDDLMCELLTSLGYAEGVKIYEDGEKWYS